MANDQSNNRPVISRGNNAPAHVNSDGYAERSFAQPNPAVVHETIIPKAHASEDSASKAVTKHSKNRRSYVKDNESAKR